MRAIRKQEQKMRAIQIARIGIARITGFYCTWETYNIYKSGFSKQSDFNLGYQPVRKCGLFPDQGYADIPPNKSGHLG